MITQYPGCESCLLQLKAINEAKKENFAAEQIITCDRRMFFGKSKRKFTFTKFLGYSLYIHVHGTCPVEHAEMIAKIRPIPQSP